MCSEERWIRFSQKEVQDSVMLFCQRTGRGLPDASNLVVDLEEAREPSARMSCRQTKKKFGTLFEREIITALILYCATQNIPLAKRAEKVAKVDGDSLVLKTTMNHR